MSHFVDTHCNFPTVLEKLNCPSLADYCDSHCQESLAPPRAILSVASDAATRDATHNLVKGGGNSKVSLHAAYGVHPLYGYDWTPEGKQEILSLMKETGTVAWGEIGLDYHAFDAKYGYTAPSDQAAIFIEQIQLALECKKPIIIHTREAEEETLAIMKEHIPHEWKIHVHCFTDSLAFCQKLISSFPNLYIGFTGVITFKKKSAAIQEVVKSVPLSRLLLETDAPYMTPVPHRGTVCHPAHVSLIASKVALLKGVSVEEVLEATNKNSQQLFGI